MTKKIILASASPRRQQLLQQLGLEFQVMASNIKEDLGEGLAPGEMARELAWQKANNVALGVETGVIIGADTMVVNGNHVMGKPENAAAAAEMLRELSGNTHKVITGVAIIEKETGATAKFYETTEVTFKELTNEEIKSYIDSGEPLDKAGAYAIQGLGAVMVRKINGCYSNVVGLPLYRLNEELKKIGINVL